MFDFETLKAMWVANDVPPGPTVSTDWREKPRTQIYICHGPVCRKEIQGTGKVPTHYVAFTCWYCDSDEHTMPRPLDREEQARVS